MINKYTVALILFLYSCQLFSQKYEQTGKCTYYADKFHGRHTTSGDHYNKNLYTAAHRKLPFNTFVKVTNTKNNKSVVVRINDRGPFSKTLIIDVSRVAAQDLDIIYAGVAPCKIEIVENPTREDSLRSYPSNRTFPDTTSSHNNKTKIIKKPVAVKDVKPANSEVGNLIPGKYYDNKLNEAFPKGFGLQLGFYKNLANCKTSMDKYSALFKKESFFHVELRNSEKYYKLIIGQFESKKEANAFMREVLQEVQSCFIVNF